MGRSLHFITPQTMSYLSILHKTAFKTYQRHPPQVPRSVQYGFTHRLRDGKNHIYFRRFCQLRTQR